MTWRRIIIYYTLGIALGGYFLLFEWESDSARPRPPRPVAQQSRFLAIPQDEISEVELQRDGAVITCRREGKTWKVTEPAGTKVTSDLVTSFVENLTPEKEVEVIEQMAKDLSPYGLDRPRATVTVKGRNIAATVLLGDHNPTGSAVYARKANSLQVVLLGSSVSYYQELIFETAGIKKQ
ncbi:MAG TPA: DUF4340 domain-containing protein [Candidatus Binatia bacterium]|jgi:hypothetical protein|nr:DUF4340 domain-containing protein [Candidatus Binatia bacterium]